MKCPKCDSIFYPWRPCCGEPPPKHWMTREQAEEWFKKRMSEIKSDTYQLNEMRGNEAEE